MSFRRQDVLLIQQSQLCFSGYFTRAKSLKRNQDQYHGSVSLNENMLQLL